MCLISFCVKLNFDKIILDKKIASEADLEVIQKKIKEQVDESVKFAEESPYPAPEDALKDVYVQEDYPFILE